MKKKGRGLSYDEKREVMLRIFHTTKTVYNYQEIQKLSVKAGIPFPSVKDILKSLQDDSLIENQKIGAGVFYWSFPSKAFQIFKQGIDTTTASINFLQKDNSELDQKITNAQAGREECSQRQEFIELIKEQESEKKDLEHEIEKYIRFDPERVQLLIKQNNQMKQKVNFWTDNLEQFKKFVKKEMPGTKDQDLEERFGIPTDLDYVE